MTAAGPDIAPGGQVHACRIDSAGLETVSGDGDLVFPYWSFTKTAIAICALKLTEQGRITLNALIPGQSFTLRQTLNHTAGLPDYTGLADVSPGGRGRRAAMAQGPPPRRRDGPGTPVSPGDRLVLLQYRLHAGPRLHRGSRGQALRGALPGDDRRGPGLRSVTLATTREQFARVCWPGARHYHPGWVYHGCLIGTAPDAARLLHGLFADRLLSGGSRERMLARHPLAGRIEGRPWTECGYALGLMSGRLGAAGRAIGHSGGGPFSVNAVYHFPDRSRPVTVASFTDGQDEGVAEREAVRFALAD